MSNKEFDSGSWYAGFAFGIAALCVASMVAVMVALILAIPFAIGVGIFFWARWKAMQPAPIPPFRQLEEAVSERTIAANFPSSDDFCDSPSKRLIQAWEFQLPALPVLTRMVEVAANIYEEEQLYNPMPPLMSSDPIEIGRRKDELASHMRRIADAPRTLGMFTDAITRSLQTLRDALPPSAIFERSDPRAMSEAPPPMTTPLIHAVDDLPHLVFDVELPFYAEEIGELRLFDSLRAQLALNDSKASEGAKSYVRPWEYKGSPREIVDTYLGGTPLRDLFALDIPFVLPDETRFSGHWVLSPPGRGKTTLLHAMVMEDLQKPGACLILMDSKGDLIDPIRNLAGIQDRLIVIDPDPQNPVAINPLDIAGMNLSQSVDLLEYLFASLLEFKMTAMQTTLFRSVLRALVTSFPNPTLETFRDLLANGAGKYADYIAALPPDLLDFFQHDFNEKNYADRRREVLQRLRLLLDNDTMRAMLTAERTRFHIGEAMDSGKVVIINNSKARLGDQGAEFFGRFFIAQVLAAAQQRSTRRQDQKPPVFFYIDECQNVIARDDKIPTILDECRSQKIALIMAHQRTRQITSENVLDALSNCAIRFANSDEEARQLAPRLRTSPEFLQSLGRGRFAAFVRDMTKQATAVTVNSVDLSAQPAITASDARMLRERMRREYGVALQIAPPAADEPTPTQTQADTAPEAPESSPRPTPAKNVPADHDDDWR